MKNPTLSISTPHRRLGFSPRRGHVLRSALASCFLLAGALLSACAAPDAPELAESPAPQQTSTLELFGEELKLENGGTLAIDRGVITAPVRRDLPASSSLEVEFYRFRRTANASPETPPIVLLHGGPGFAGLGPKLEDLGYFEARVARFTEISDVIVPGQRGFGSSTDTPCDPTRDLTPEEAQDPNIRRQVIREAVVACQDKWRAQDLDPTGFNIVEAAADVADIAKLLGYEKIQLRGISFGSHWGMAVLRYHPDLVARAVLASLEGPDHTYDMPSGVLAAFGRIATSVEASPALAAKIPEGGILEAFQRMVEKADAEPFKVEIEDPRDQQPLTVTLDGDALRQVFAGSRRFTQFRFRMNRWPPILLEMLGGDLAEAANNHVWNLMDTDLENAAYFGYDCGSGVSQSRGAQIRSDPAARLIGPTWSRLDNFCDAWSGDLGEQFRSPFRTSVPTVLVHGTWDTSTPIENALEVRPFFENHHFVTVEGGSHGAIREAIEGVQGFKDAMDQWLATGESAQIPEVAELPPLAWQGPE